MSTLDDCTVSSLLGKTLIKIEVNDRNDEILFITDENKKYRMYHYQDCCESVSIEDIVGDLDDLIDSPLTMSEVTSQSGEESSWGSSTWTFYKFATVKGYVTIRWLGESNGYYSEEVSFELINEPKQEPEPEYVVEFDKNGNIIF